MHFRPPRLLTIASALLVSCAGTTGLSGRDESTSTAAEWLRAAAVPILMYHQIRDLPHEPDRSAFTFSVEPAEFACQLEYLASHGFHTITLDQLDRHLRLGKPLPSKPVILTFDDGWSSALDAACALKARGMVGVFFVCPDLLSPGPGQRYLSWADVQRMSDMGMSIQSHTLTHPHLPGVTDATLIRELADSRERLEAAVGRPITSIAYPFGEFDDRIVIAAMAAGYTVGVGTEPRTTHTLAQEMHFGRINMHYFLDLHEFERILLRGIR